MLTCEPEREIIKTADLTTVQKRANMLMASSAQHVLLRGGSRSGKTTVICRALCIRALKAVSTHAVLREKFNHLKHSIIFDTMPKVLDLWFPNVKVGLNKSDWFHEFPNGSKLIYGGLDDKERAEKILGQEHSTMYLNESSQISFASRNKAVTRLAQSSGLKLKMLYDCNPPPKSHWLYKVFELKVDPLTGEDLKDPENYVSTLLNPKDNAANLPPETIQLLENMTERDRKRFLDGEWAEAVANALWPENSIKRVSKPVSELEWKQLEHRLRRIVVSVDPSGCDSDEEVNNDEIGIVVCGLLDDGTGLVLQDETGYYTPSNWAKASVDLYYRWGADVILGETNFGGAMVVSNIKAIDKNVNVKKITVSRAKHIRAEPVANLYEEEKVKHLGYHPELENELQQFSTSGYKGAKSPNRADAAITGISELFNLNSDEKDIGVW